MKLQIVDTVKNLKKDARAARIVELVINCVVLAIFAAVVIRPVVIDILEARDQQEELSNMAGQLSSKAESIRTAESNINEYSSSFELLTEAMPLAPRQFDMLNQIQLAGEIEGVNVGQLSHQSVAAETVDFNLIGSGQYEQVVSFVRRVENLPRLIQLNNISLSTDTTDDESNPSLSFTVTGTGYYYNEEVALLNDDVTEE